MSGLFLRLAAQASGQRGATLRSPAALPYQGAQQRMEPLESTADQPDLPRVQATATEQPVFAPVSETATRLPTRQRYRLPDSEAMSPLAPDKQAPVFASHAFQTQDEPAAVSSLTVPPSLITQPIRTATANFSAQQAEAASPQNPRQTTEWDAPNPLAGSARNDSAVSREDSGTLPLPAALLSPRQVEPRHTVAAVTPASASPIPSPQPDEVHIHIGRIEVTAIQEGAPSKRPSRKGAAPLSLDDYLAKRKGDSR